MKTLPSFQEKSIQNQSVNRFPAASSTQGVAAPALANVPPCRALLALQHRAAQLPSSPGMVMEEGSMSRRRCCWSGLQSSGRSTEELSLQLASQRIRRWMHPGQEQPDCSTRGWSGWWPQGCASHTCLCRASPAPAHVLLSPALQSHRCFRAFALKKSSHQEQPSPHLHFQVDRVSGGAAPRLCCRP